MCTFWYLRNFWLLPRGILRNITSGHRAQSLRGKLEDFQEPNLVCQRSVLPAERRLP